MTTRDFEFQLAAGLRTVEVRYEQFGGNRRFGLAWRPSGRPTGTLEFYRPGAGRIVRPLLAWVALVSVLAAAAALVLARRDDELVCGLTIACAVSQRLWLAAAQARTAYRGSLRDDFMYARLGDSIAKGEWLGTFDSLTLSKPPGYSLWIAANHYVPGSLRLADELLYVAAVTIVVVALRPVASSRARAAIALALLWLPASLYAGKLRFMREAIYGSLVLIIAACIVAYLARSDRATSRLPWSVLLGAATGFAWITREEGPWLLPMLAMGALAAILLNRVRDRDAWSRLGVEVLAAATAGAVIVAGVMLANHQHYGIGALRDNHTAEYNGALGALSRIDPDRWMQHVLVRRSAFEQAFEVSPTLAGIRDTLGAKVIEHGWETREMYPEHGPEARDSGGDWVHRDEAVTAYFAWALRESMEIHGHYFRPEDAQAFLADVGREVNAACAAGQLHCSAPRNTWLPAWEWRFAGDVFDAIGRGLAHSVWQAPDDVVPFASDGDRAAIRWFEDLTRDRIAPVRGELAFAADSWKLDALEIAIQVWHGVYVVFLALGLVAVVRTPSRLAANRAIAFGAVAISGSIAARLVILGYLDARSSVVIEPTYLTTTMPMTMLVMALLMLNLRTGPGNNSR